MNSDEYKVEMRLEGLSKTAALPYIEGGFFLG